MDMDHLDYVLVPVGLLLMLVYHIWLIRQIICRPATTLMGINALNRRLWVGAMMQDVAKNGILAVQTLRNNIMASTLLASTAIMLSSVIAVLMSGSGSSSSLGLSKEDNSGKLGFPVKIFSLLACFLVAFLLNVQSIRYYSHASILINVPDCIPPTMNGDDGERLCTTSVTSDCVGKIVNRGNLFWWMGLRAFYLSFPLFLWIFGAVPMVACCVLLVIVLYFLDVSFHECGLPEHQGVVRHSDEEEIGV